MKNNKSKHLFLLTFSASALLVALIFVACGNTGGDASTHTGSTEKFREGLYRYEDVNRFGDFCLIRSNGTQLDSGTMTKLKVLFDMEWDTDTSYTLTFKEMVANPMNMELPDLKGMFRKCWVTGINDTSYIETSTSTLNKDTLKVRVIKVK